MWFKHFWKQFFKLGTKGVVKDTLKKTDEEETPLSRKRSELTMTSVTSSTLSLVSLVENSFSDSSVITTINVNLDGHDIFDRADNMIEF
jgi:hypothetical protein